MPAEYEAMDVQQLQQVAALTSRKIVNDSSRVGYNSKLKYIIKFMSNKFPDQLETNSAGKVSLKLPLTFASIEALFAAIQVDTNLPKKAGKRKREEDANLEELRRIRREAIERGDENIPEEPMIREDTSINKANSITVSKQCIQGYKSALKTHYRDRGVEFTCPERAVGLQSVDEYLNTQMRSYANLMPLNFI